MAPPEIALLIETFERNRETYLGPRYNETQVRVEFLDPLFIALGWDVHNTAGYAAPYKDVVHEDQVKIGAATKAPDYCFRIGGSRKFFLEAKKPGVDIKNDPAPAFQLRRYAWSAKLPLSILSDFEEFAVYDTRIKPEAGDAASVGRVFYYSYRDYLEKWDEIAGIFSKEAVLKGSFDKYAESAKKKKGTAEVDAAFLKEMESWREELAKNIALRNPRLTTRELNFAVQATLDRIIFLRICEDRGIENYGQLLALLNGTNLYRRLFDLFDHADDKYNSGLFHFKKEKDRPEPDTLSPGLAIDDKALKEIIRRLYYPESPYEFSVLPSDILGQVYEQFLGKVIRLTAGHQAKVEDKPEVKKAGGVYYTPTYIVDYIVKNTVGKILEGRGAIDRAPDVAATALRTSASSVESSRKKTKKSKSGTDIPVCAPLRILDPACGSGSFLLGAYQYLLDWYRDQYVKQLVTPSDVGRTGDRPVAPTTASKSLPIYQTMGGEWRLTTPERKRILLDHIYGVDIDTQAVEVTKLSLLLKCLEGETEESLRQMKLFHKERALPDLSGNIKCGNSLIGPDFYQGRQMTMFSEDERYRVNVFDWKTGFPEVFHHRATEDTEKKNGFDVVIGNPPYGAYLYETEKDYLTNKFPNQSYQLDSYQLFLEQSINILLKQSGLYGMIIPNPWLTNILQKGIRKFVLNQTRIVEIVHFLFKVFPKVTVDNEIVILEKGNSADWQSRAIIVESLDAFTAPTPKAGINLIVHQQNKWRELDGETINLFLNPSQEALALKCKSSGIVLSSLCDINVGIKPYQVGKGTPPQTRPIVEGRIFDSNKRLNKFYRLYLRGADISRYFVNPLEYRYLKYGPWLAEPRPAANFDAPLKLLMRQTGDSLIAALDLEQYLCLNNMHVLVPKPSALSPYYILSILNSKVLNWYYQTLNPEKGEALAEVKKTNVANLPIKTIDLKNKKEKLIHANIESLAKELIGMNKVFFSLKVDHERESLRRQIAATDAEIDRLVYELYGLTEEEIRIVEGG